MLSITDNAKQQIKNIIASEPEGSFLRVRVDSGGCSGFEYQILIDSIKTFDDVIINTGENSVLIDKLSLSFLEGAILDFTQDTMAKKFTILNPKAKISCGCGNSFSV